MPSPKKHSSEKYTFKKYSPDKALSKSKSQLHPRNKHRDPYDYVELIKSCPELSQHIQINEHKVKTLDYTNKEAVLLLNKALLKHFYQMEHWEIPPNYLCPPIPGRADYIHYVADLLASKNKIPRGGKIFCLDVGVGANCIYPIIGNKEYGWKFLGSDIHPLSLKSAENIRNSNPSMQGVVDFRLQSKPKDIFQGIIRENEYIDVTLCNPPFHSSQEEANASSRRKTRTLTRKKVNVPTLNFGGQSNELWIEGGEIKFLETYIHQSKDFDNSCFWYTTLVSKQSNLNPIYKLLKQVKALEIKTIPMSQGNKTSRLVAWTFLTPELQKIWVDRKWNR